MWYWLCQRKTQIHAWHECSVFSQRSLQGLQLWRPEWLQRENMSDKNSFDSNHLEDLITLSGKLQENKPGQKIIIICQFIKFLDLIQEVLNHQSSTTCLCYNGSSQSLKTWWEEIRRWEELIWWEKFELWEQRKETQGVRMCDNYDWGLMEALEIHHLGLFVDCVRVIGLFSESQPFGNTQAMLIFYDAHGETWKKRAIPRLQVWIPQLDIWSTTWSNWVFSGTCQRLWSMCGLDPHFENESQSSFSLECDLVLLKCSKNRGISWIYLIGKFQVQQYDRPN